jgi:hypothetical protein
MLANYKGFWVNCGVTPFQDVHSQFMRFAWWALGYNPTCGTDPGGL